LAIVAKKHEKPRFTELYLSFSRKTHAVRDALQNASYPFLRAARRRIIAKFWVSRWREEIFGYYGKKACKTNI
jgi:hypothetical protein